MELEEWEFLNGQQKGAKLMGLDPRGGVVDRSYFTPPPPPLLLQPMQEDSTSQRVSPEPVVERNPDVDQENDEVGVTEPTLVKNPDVAAKRDIMEEINIAAPVAIANVIYQAFYKSMEENGSKADDTLVNPNDDFSDEDDETRGSDIKGKKDFWEVFSLSSWRSRGIRELRSVGVAAATLCIFMLGGHLGYQQQQLRIRNPKLQLCNYDKATSPVGGASPTSARISFGGYYGASASTKSLLDDMLL